MMKPISDRLDVPKHMMTCKSEITTENRGWSSCSVILLYFVLAVAAVDKGKEPHIELNCHFDSNIPIEADSGQSDPVQLGVDVFAYPDPSEMTWWKNGEKISEDNTEKYEVLKSNKQTTLTIKIVEGSDTANYTLVVRVGLLTKTVTALLLVAEAPKVTFDLHGFHHLFEKFYYYTCNVRGLPLPNVSWSWRPCRQIDCDTIPYQLLNASMNKEFTRTSNVSYDHIESNIFVAASQSGFYKCDAYNSKGHAFKEKEFIVTDIDSSTGYLITPPNNTNYSQLESTELIIKCQASKYNFKSNIEWFRVTSNMHDTLAGNRTGLTITHHESKFSYTSTLNIKSLALNDSGQYYCVVRNKVSNMHTQLTNKVTVEGHNRYLVTGAQIKIIKRRTKYLPQRPVPGELDTTGISAKVKGVIITVVFLVLLSLVVLSILLLRKIYEEKKERQEIYKLENMLFSKGAMECYNPHLPWEDQIDFLPYDQQWEFPRDKLKLGQNIGQGAFGRVVQAEAQGILVGERSTTVAVKMLKDQSNLEQRKALMQELKIMIHLGRHVNILNLLGACTQNWQRGDLLMILEFCRFGNLRNCLLSHRHSFINQINPETGEITSLLCGEAYSSSAASNNMGTDGYLVPLNLGLQSVYSNSPKTVHSSVTISNCGSDEDSAGFGKMYQNHRKEKSSEFLTTCDLVCYALQIANGMEYLSARKLVHRDLAARNLLLAENNVVKICDFGLTKDLDHKEYYRKKGDGPLPVKWMAVESIRYRVFTTESDVWSFGIVMWELFTLGSNPYPGLEVDENFYKKLLSGYRMDKPEFANNELNCIINQCWAADPKDRPTFSELVERLGNQLDAKTRKHYEDLNLNYLCLYKLSTNTPDYSNIAGELHFHYDNVPNPSLVKVNLNDCNAASERPNYLDIRDSEDGLSSSARPCDVIDSKFLELMPMLSGSKYETLPKDNYK